MPTIRAVFFDLDDTLCDAKTAFAQASTVSFDAIRARHPQVSETQVIDAWRTIQVPLFADLAAGRLSMAQVRLARFRRLLAALGHPDDDFADEVDLLLGYTQLDLLTLFDGVTDTLAELRERGLYVGIITNGAGDLHPDSQRSKAEHLGLPGRVDSFWVSDEIGHRKPDPRAFLPALGAAGCKPTEALYVGDSPENDVLGANRTGMVSVLFRRGDTSITGPSVDILPHYVIASVADVLRLVAEEQVTTE